MCLSTFPSSQGKALEYAPPGRQHELRCDQVGRATVELVESAAERLGRCTRAF